MTRPLLRVQLESGDTYDDPSEDLLLMLFEEIEQGGSLFMIVEKLADASGQTYVQALRNEDGSYLVETRAGTSESHRSTTAAHLREAHALVTGWAFDR